VSEFCCAAYVAFWHIASFRGNASFWSLSERTLSRIYENTA